MTKKTKTIIWIVVAVVIVAIVGMLLSDVFDGTKEVLFGEFEAKLKAGEINKLYVDAYNWTGYTIDASGKTVAKYTTVGPSLYDYLSYSQFLSDTQASGSINI